MDTEKIGKVLYEETMEEIKQAKERATNKFWKKPLVYVSIVLGLSVIIGVIIGKII